MKLRIEQAGKGGLPPLLPDLSGRETAGVNPSLLVQLNVYLFSPKVVGLESF
jgi:hypothetical protein